MKTIAITGATLVGLCGVAAAQPDYHYDDDYDYDYDGDEPREVSPQRGLDFEVGVGFLGGSYGVGGIHDGGSGVAITAGWRRGRALVLGEYDGVDAGGDDLEEGVMHRLGGAVRVDLDYFGKGLTSSVWAGGILWAEAGLGWERYGWEGGSRLDRNDVSLGLGAQYTIRFGAAKPKLIGIYYAAKFLVAKAPEPITVARLCVEGCGVEQMSARDYGVFFSAAITMGR